MTSPFFQQRPFAKAGLLAIPVLICILLMVRHFPKGPIAGYQSKIIAFEFVTNVDEVREVLGSLSTEELAGMDRGNYIDFAFVLCYGTFISYFFWLAHRYLGVRWFKIGIGLGVLVFLGDVLENIQLLNITRAYANGPDQMEVSAFVDQLQLFTWIKWIGLSITLLLAALAFRRLGGIWRWLGLLLTIPFLLSIIALITHSSAWIERFTSSMFLGFGAWILCCFFITRSGAPSSASFQ